MVSFVLRDEQHPLRNLTHLITSHDHVLRESSNLISSSPIVVWFICYLRQYILFGILVSKAYILRGRSHDHGSRAGPLSGINFSCFHMVVFIPPTVRRFDIDWYVYLKVWKINYVIPSTHAHLNIFHPSRREGVLIWENSSPLAEISLSGPARLPGSYEQVLSLKHKQQCFMGFKTRGDSRVF